MVELHYLSVLKELEDPRFRGLLISNTWRSMSYIAGKLIRMSEKLDYNPSNRAVTCSDGGNLIMATMDSSDPYLNLMNNRFDMLYYDINVNSRYIRIIMPLIRSAWNENSRSWPFVDF